MRRLYWLAASAFLAWPIWDALLEEWAEAFHAWALRRTPQ
ncbi:hypothetical protein SEA_EMOTION_37 [Arthrobacter phage Emotion]|uniref:Uncharacterized protein n=1 Tax=Arthrobacter phage Emotion TaxID=3038361 RepID=A0AA49IKY0_9CAUD|nr:hypothetical protein SEA_EMOTION_37 [Arthrobacter phage Emotion]